MKRLNEKFLNLIKTNGSSYLGLIGASLFLIVPMMKLMDYGRDGVERMAQLRAERDVLNKARTSISTLMANGCSEFSNPETKLTATPPSESDSGGGGSTPFQTGLPGSPGTSDQGAMSGSYAGGSELEQFATQALAATGSLYQSSTDTSPNYPNNIQLKHDAIKAVGQDGSGNSAVDINHETLYRFTSLISPTGFNIGGPDLQAVIGDFAVTTREKGNLIYFRYWVNMLLRVQNDLTLDPECVTQRFSRQRNLFTWGYHSKDGTSPPSTENLMAMNMANPCDSPNIDCDKDDLTLGAILTSPTLGPKKGGVAGGVVGGTVGGAGTNPKGGGGAPGIQVQL